MARFQQPTAEPTPSLFQARPWRSAQTLSRLSISYIVSVAYQLARL